MYDRPALEELIEAVQHHMETAVIPAVRDDGKLYFQTLVAINVLKIAQREMQLGAQHTTAEWQRLNTLMQTEIPPEEAEMQAILKERNAALCTEIRAGKFDMVDRKTALFEHLKETVIEKLEVANPRFLQTIAREEHDPSLDAWNGR